MAAMTGNYFSHSLGVDHGQRDKQAVDLLPNYRVLRYDPRGPGARTPQKAIIRSNCSAGMCWQSQTRRGWRNSRFGLRYEMYIQPKNTNEFSQNVVAE